MRHKVQIYYLETLDLYAFCLNSMRSRFQINENPLTNFIKVNKNKIKCNCNYLYECNISHRFCLKMITIQEVVQVTNMNV